MIMLTQELLREEAQRRLAESGVHVAPERLLNGDAPPDLGKDALCVLVILRAFDLLTFLDGTLTFTSSLPEDVLRGWYHSFTRTIFLVGDPRNLAQRFSFAHVTQDRSVAWTRPAPQHVYTGLRRLLKLFDASALPKLPKRIECSVPGNQTRSAIRRRLYFNFKGLSLEEYLIHLNHTLCESVFRGVLHPGDALELIHVEAFHDPVEPYDYLRVHADQADSSRFKVFAYLTRELRYVPE
jgi:hypothetical protein